MEETSKKPEDTAENEKTVTGSDSKGTGKDQPGADKPSEAEMVSGVKADKADSGNAAKDNSDIDIKSIDELNNSRKSSDSAGKDVLSLPVKHKQYKKQNKTAKKIRKIVITLVVILIAVFVAVRYSTYTKMQKAQKAASSQQYAEVERRDVSSTISTTGTVQSKDTRTVTSALTGVTIEKVNYEVGDIVNEGDIIVEFSREDIDKKIEDLQADIAEAEGVADLTATYKATEHTYDYGTADYNNYVASNQTNEQSISVDEAQKTLDEACASKSEFVNKYETAKANIESVEDELEDAEIGYSAFQQQYPKAPDLPTDLNDQAALNTYYAYWDAKNYWEDLISDLTSTIQSYETTINNYDSQISTYTQKIESAQTSLDAAKRKLTSQEASESETNRNQANNLTTSDYNYAKDTLTANDNINSLTRQMEQYTDQIEDYIVYAPITGLVTSVTAQEGNGYVNTSGGLMTIQAIDTFEISTQIDEYDINNVAIGQKVVIMTDATGDDELEGEVTFISPIATSAASGTTSTSGNTYEVKIDILSDDSRVMLGMDAKINIILDQHADTLAIRYDAIEEDTKGSYVYVVDPKDIEKTDSESGAAAGMPDASAAQGADGGIEVIGADGMDIDTSDGAMPSGAAPNAKATGQQSFISYLFDFSAGSAAQTEDTDKSGSSLTKAMKKVYVTTGLEDDYYTEISGDGISEGTTVMIPSTTSTDSTGLDMMTFDLGGGGMGGGGMGGGPGGGGPGM